MACAGLQRRRRGRFLLHYDLRIAGAASSTRWLIVSSLGLEGMVRMGTLTILETFSRPRMFYRGDSFHCSFLESLQTLNYEHLEPSSFEEPAEDNSLGSDFGQAVVATQLVLGLPRSTCRG